MGPKAPRPGPRLNPFVLPAETEARFTLLVVAALLLVSWVGTHLANNLSDEQALLLIGRYPQADSLPAGLAFEDTLAEQGTRVLVFARHKLAFLRGPIGLVLVLVALTSVIYFRHPQRIRRKFPVEPFTQETAPRLYPIVQELLARADLRNPPEIELGNSMREASGQAYGFEERSFLRLDHGLARLLTRMRGYVEAVILHELGHVTNRDVSRYHFARAIWTATAILAFVPITLWQAFYLVRNLFFGWGGSVLLNLFFVLQVAVALLAIRAIQAGLARAREHDADWRAALWGGHEIMQESLTGRKTPPSPFWKRPWLFHPAAGERLTALRDPARLFRLRLDLPLITGFVSAFAVSGVVILVLIGGLCLIAFVELLGLQLGVYAPRLAGDLLLVGQLLVGTLLVLPALGIAALISGTLGLQVQRQAIADQNAGRGGIVSYLKLLIPAGVLMFGFEVGLLVTPFPLLSSFMSVLLPDPISFRPVSYLALHLTASVLFATVLALARLFARRVLCAHSGVRPPERARRRFSLLLTAILWAILVPFIVGREILRGGGTLYGVLTVPLLVLPLLIGLLALGTAFLVLLFLGRSRLLRCVHCGQTQRSPGTVGRRCEKCTQPLAPWAYVPES
jgi:Zn-dependent protease with chaperone function